MESKDGMTGHVREDSGKKKIGWQKIGEQLTFGTESIDPHSQLSVSFFWGVKHIGLLASESFLLSLPRTH